jgi:hypothetical protein
VTTCPLKPGELDALTAYVEAGSTKGAAHALGVSEHTVKNRLGHARARTGRTTEQLIYSGTLAGWLRLRKPAG